MLNDDDQDVVYAPVMTRYSAKQRPIPWLLIGVVALLCGAVIAILFITLKSKPVVQADEPSSSFTVSNERGVILSCDLEITKAHNCKIAKSATVDDVVTSFMLEWERRDRAEAARDRARKEFFMERGIFRSDIAMVRWRWDEQH